MQRRPVTLFPSMIFAVLVHHDWLDAEEGEGARARLHRDGAGQRR